MLEPLPEYACRGLSSGCRPASQPGCMWAPQVGITLRRHCYTRSSSAQSIPLCNPVQNKQSNKTAGDMQVVQDLQGRLYCEDTPLTEEEQQEGVDAEDELDAWAAMCAERQAAGVGGTGGDAAAGALQLLLGDADDWEEEEGGEEAQATGSEGEELEDRRRRRSGRDGRGGGFDGRRRHQAPRQHIGRAPPPAPQGGQRAAVAVAAAYAAYAGSQQQSQQQGQQPLQQQQQQCQQPSQEQQHSQVQGQQPSQQQQQQSQQQSQQPLQQQHSQARSPRACFKCGREGHWAAKCPQLKSGNCFRVGVDGRLLGILHLAPFT